MRQADAKSADIGVDLLAGRIWTAASIGPVLPKKPNHVDCRILARLWDLIGWGDRIAFRNSELRMVRAIAWYRSVPCPEAPGGTVGLWGPEERKCCFNQAAMRHRTLW